MTHPLMTHPPMLTLSADVRPAAVPSTRSAPLAAMLSEPLLVRSCAAIAALQIGLSAAKLPAWPCVFFHLTDLPCPGCGLTRSCTSLLHGNLAQSLQYHPFGPLLLAGIATFTVAAFLPKSALLRLTTAVARAERSTRLTYILTIAFCLYWPLRLGGMFPLPV